MLRLHLPPNLVAAAGRDAIPVKVDLDLTAEPSPAVLPALALLQRWCGGSTPPKFLQLSRAQLRELAGVLRAQPVFVEGGHPTAWRHDALLAEPTATRPATPDSSLAPPRKSAPSAGAAMVIDGSEHFLAVTLPSREHPAYAEVLELLRSSGFVLEPSNRKWWLRDRHRTLNFLAQHGADLHGRFGAQFTSNFERQTARLRRAELVCEAAETSGGYEVTLAVKAGDASDESVRSAALSNRAYVEAGGQIYLLDSRRLQQLDAAQRALAGAPEGAAITRRTHQIRPAQVAEAQEIIEQLSPDFQPPETWRYRSEALRNLTRLPPAPVPSGLDAQLRPYQRLGVAWLWHLYRSELGGVLADEMGLGKTAQALALLTPTRAAATASGSGGAARGVRRTTPAPLSPSLVVCPASLLENWRREAVRFAPELRVFVHHASRRIGGTADFAAYDLIVTSYGTLTRDWELFAAVRFDCIVADEAQHIKNRRSQNAAALRSLRSRSRFLLTGTPLENSLQDLRSLFEFLLPGYLAALPSGLNAEQRAWHDDRLRAKVAPYILRRTKLAVAPELPARLEQTIWCELSDAQAALYRETQQRLERELFALEAGGATEAKLRFAALTQLLRLRQICCDPRLVPGGSREDSPPDSATASLDEASDTGAVGSGDPDQRSSPAASAPYRDSGKLDAFRELLAEAVDDGHRLLVFSQFTSLLALLRAELERQDVPHCYLDGSMSPRRRQEEVDRFQTSELPVFLISLKAGGTGLNLTAADTVVHFDPWWNPAAEAQATDRAHRIGQTRVVTSYKLIAGGTVEEKVLALQEEKRALLAGVFEASDAAAAQLSLADLKGLLS